MKEGPILSADGTVCLDPDREETVSSNGTHPEYANVPSSVEAFRPPADSPKRHLETCPEEAPEQDVSLVKKKIKPPMPPSKEARPSAAPVRNDELLFEDLETSKSPEIQPGVPTTGEAAEKDGSQETPEASLDLEMTPDQPTTPATPSKNGASSPEETSETRSSGKPPALPCKGKKPPHAAAKPDQEVLKATEETNNLTSSQTELDASEPAGGLATGPPVPPKKPQSKTSHLGTKPVSDQTGATVHDPPTGAGDPARVSVSEEEAATGTEASAECVPLDDAVPGDPHGGAASGHVAWDSGEGEATATDGHARTPQLDTDPQAAREEPPEPASVPEVPPVKPWAKARSASHGDLLLPSPAHDAGATPPDDVATLRVEVLAQVEKTNELLLRLSKLAHLGAQVGAQEVASVARLATAAGKLKTAGRLLAEGRGLGPPKSDGRRRKSW